MNIAEAVLKYLRNVGVDCIFGIPAGIIGPIYDALIDVDIKPIITKNEAGAAYMAARYASNSGKLAVCAGAGAVGVGNMMNGIADAMRAKAPLLVITGYVNRWQIGKGAIQEMDAQDIVRPITKYSNTVMNEADVLAELDKAVRIALTPLAGLCIFRFRSMCSGWKRRRSCLRLQSLPRFSVFARIRMRWSVLQPS